MLREILNEPWLILAYIFVAFLIGIIAWEFIKLIFYTIAGGMRDSLNKDKNKKKKKYS